ncbi:MAG: hypothetical protein AAFQ61_04085 [Cyanobacteria bacterium J06626_23]
MLRNLMIRRPFSVAIVILSAGSLLAFNSVGVMGQQQRMDPAPQRTPQGQVQIDSSGSETPGGPTQIQAPGGSTEYECHGYIDCNNAISDCIAADGDFEATEYDEDGGVIGGSCTH